MTVLGDVRDLGTFQQPVARRTRVHTQIRQALVLVAMADLAAVVGSVLLAWDLRVALDLWAMNVDPAQSLAATVGPWVVVLWMFLLAVQGAYSPRYFGAGADEFKRLYLASALAAGTVGMACYLFEIELSRGFMTLAFAIGVPVLTLERYAARKILHHVRAKGRLQHKVVVVGGPSAVREVVEVLRRERHLGYDVVGACVPSGIALEPGTLPVRHLGDVQDVARSCSMHGADTVLVARGGYASSADLRRLAWSLEESGIDLVVVPSLTDVAGPRIHMRPVAGLPLLHVEGPQADEAGGLAKRLFDVVLSVALIMLLSPLMLAVTVLVKLEDGGPVFFRQTRAGRDGRTFRMIKFRSMITDAEKFLDDVRHLNESDGALFKVRNDPRVTRVGSFLRKYSLDELPQLFNVLLGDMSLVGPRPPLPTEVATYQEDVRRRLLVRPGMTGLWQVSGRSELSWSEAVRLDLYYVDNWSMVSDLAIMARTIKAVLVSDGAY